MKSPLTKVQAKVLTIQQESVTQRIQALYSYFYNKLKNPNTWK